jgi:hypothetical protein
MDGVERPDLAFQKHELVWREVNQRHGTLWSDAPPPLANAPRGCEETAAERTTTAAQL